MVNYYVYKYIHQVLQDFLC